MKLIVFGVLLVVLSAGFASSDARPQVPALYVFGDSLVDVGNNKYLPPSPNVSTVDFLPYGIDFSHSKPTGRFSNGYNSLIIIYSRWVDIYVSACTSVHVSVSLSHLLRACMQNLYELGARKFAILGISLVGCTPAARSQFPNCSSAANSFAGLFNNATTLVLQNMSDALEGFNYSFCSAYNLVNEVVVNPQKYGFTNITNQCCGYDEKDLKCRPTSHYCDDRRKFVFWDGVHPTEAMCEIAGSAFYNGSQEFAFPHNLMQLAKEE